MSERLSSRGAVSVEAALAVPILALLLFGLIELGLAWRTSNRLATSTHVAALSLSRDVEDRLADHDALGQVVSTMGGSVDDVTAVIVYRTSDSHGMPPSACTSIAESIAIGSSGVLGQCNVYSGSFLATLSPSQFMGSDCVGEPDAAFCPTTRRASFGTDDRIAVEVRLRHEWATNFLPGGGKDLVDRGVATLEPEVEL